MITRTLAALALCTLVLTTCAKQPTVPGVLEVHLSGMWGTMPNMIVRKEPYPFLARLTGYVPSEAFMVIVTNEFGNVIASAPIKYQDPMQTNPVRNYQFRQTISQRICTILADKPMKPDNIVEELDTYEGRGRLTLDYNVEFTARVVTQERKTLAEGSYTLLIHCTNNDLSL